MEILKTKTPRRNCIKLMKSTNQSTITELSSSKTDSIPNIDHTTKFTTRNDYTVSSILNKYPAN